MKTKFYYQDYEIVLTPDYGITDLVEDNWLINAEIAFMFQEGEERGYTDSEELFPKYRIIFKIYK